MSRSTPAFVNSPAAVAIAVAAAVSVLTASSSPQGLHVMRVRPVHAATIAVADQPDEGVDADADADADASRSRGVAKIPRRIGDIDIPEGSELEQVLEEYFSTPSAASSQAKPLDHSR